MANRTGVLVVGGGIIGVCAAYYLAQKGWRVTLVEKGEVCAGCSYGNAGLIVPSHSMPLAAPGVLAKGLKWMRDPESPFYIKPRLSPDLLSWLWKFGRACSMDHVRSAIPVLRDLNYASLALYRELAATDGFEFGFARNGVLAVFRTEKGHEEAIEEAHLLQEFGIGAKILDGAEARAVEANLSTDVVGGVYYPDDAHLIPDAFVKGLARIAQAKGVRVLASTEALGFRMSGRRVAAVETTRGDFESEEVVLATGSWSAGIARTLGLRLPIQPAKGYSVTCERSEDGPTVPLLLGEGRVAVTPMGETLRLAGTLELAGLDLSINRRRVHAVRRSASQYLSATRELRVLEIWGGMRPCTPDGLPIIGRPEGVENLILATGHAMIGVSLGPITGKLVAQLVSREDPMLDLRLLNPGRF